MFYNKNFFSFVTCQIKSNSDSYSLVIGNAKVSVCVFKRGEGREVRRETSIWRNGDPIASHNAPQPGVPTPGVKPKTLQFMILCFNQATLARAVMPIVNVNFVVCNYRFVSRSILKKFGYSKSQYNKTGS